MKKKKRTEVRKALSLGSVLILVGLGASASTVGFNPAQTYTVGTNPAAVAVGDFNGDGRMDLAVVNFGDPTTGNIGSVSILFGNMDGTFQPAKDVLIGKNSRAVVADDFNGDGNWDLALVRSGDPTVSDDGDVAIFLGNGDGTFQAGPVLKPGKNPSGIVAVDMNADQRLDLAVANQNDASVSVFLGNGDGTFQSPVAYATGQIPRSVQVVDFDGDGIRDLVVFRSLGIDVLLSNGDGTFRKGPSVASGGVLGTLQPAGDFNNDGKLDLIHSSCSFFPPRTCGTEVWLGNGDGTFQHIGPAPAANAATDLDGDGNLDVVAVNTSTGTAQVQVSGGNGDGTFQQPVSFAAGASPKPLIDLAADINGDKAPDLVMINYDSSGSNMNSITVMLNIGTDFSISASPPVPASLSPGQSATSILTMHLLTAFNNPVSLSCAVQPAQGGSPTCAVNSSPFVFDANGKASAQLTIRTGNSNVSLARPSSGIPAPWLLPLSPVAGFAFLGMSVGRHSARKKRQIFRWLACFAFAVLISQVACGGANSSPKETLYTITITGVSGATQHSTSIPIAVR